MSINICVPDFLRRRSRPLTWKNGQSDQERNYAFHSGFLCERRLAAIFRVSLSSESCTMQIRSWQDTTHTGWKLITQMFHMNVASDRGKSYAFPRWSMGTEHCQEAIECRYSCCPPVFWWTRSGTQELRTPPESRSLTYLDSRVRENDSDAMAPAFS